MYQYFVKIVPTVYKKLSGSVSVGGGGGEDGGGGERGGVEGDS